MYNHLILARTCAVCVPALRSAVLPLRPGQRERLVSVRTPNPDAEWQYRVEPCRACNGTGRV